MFDQLYSWDRYILRLINIEWQHPFLDHFLSLMADFNLLKWPLIAGGGALLVLGKCRERVFLLLLALCLLIGDAGINSTIKKAVNRPRPHQAEEGLRRVQREGFGIRVEPTDPGPVDRGRSFTSGHVCNNVSIALILTWLYRPWGALAWIWALLMGYSRVYTADHYPLDVLGSFIIAFAYTWAIGHFAQLVWSQAGPRWAPSFFQKYPDLLNPVPR